MTLPEVGLDPMVAALAGLPAQAPGGDGPWWEKTALAAVPDLDDDPYDGYDDEPADRSDPGRGLLPKCFWAARSELTQIRQAAHSRNRSGDVALYATLTRLSGMVSHHIRADTGVADLVSLNLFAAVVGPSGAGKSTGVSVAKRLLVPPPDLDFLDGLPVGSGEGLAEIFMDTIERETGAFNKKGDPVMERVRAQVRHNAFFYVDEGATLTRLMKERSGSTLGETLRSAAVGQTLGQTNASKETTRYIRGGSYSMGMLVGFQPETAAPLFEEQAEGTPQRFLWGLVIDPSIPDTRTDWPGELVAWRQVAQVAVSTTITFEAGISEALWRADLARARGEAPAEESKPLDSHAPVMRVKVASLLAILAGRLHVNTEDWQLAQIVWETSCDARDSVIEYSERQRRLDLERRTKARITEEVRIEQAKVAAEEDRTDKAVDRVAKRIANLAHDSGPVTRSTIRDKLAGRDKKYVGDAIAYAIARNWVLEQDAKIAPGGSRPG